MARPLTEDEQCTLKPKDAFKECDKCPEMVVAPTGSFVMGSPQSEEGEKNEGPQHTVTLSRPFAAGRYPVIATEIGFDLGVLVSDTKSMAAWLVDIQVRAEEFLDESFTNDWGGNGEADV